MGKYQIFISYRREGGDALAGRLADRLNALGYKVFYDVESMRSGTFNTQILEAIAQCSDVLVVLPPNGLDRCMNEDDWVRQELSFALKQNKTIIPVMMRGFEFPCTLPAGIDAIRNMEGVEASQVYFDAVIERIVSLLESGGNTVNLLNQQLETQEYYKITTPMFSAYKKNDVYPKGYLGLAVFTEKLEAENSHFGWRVPKIEKIEIQSLRDFIRFCRYGLEWYDKYKDRIEKLRNISIALKKYDDLYFYNHALFFAMGCFDSFPGHVIRLYLNQAVEVFCYSMDIPEEQFWKLKEVYCKEKKCDLEFKHYLPLVFEAWVKLGKENRVESEHVQKFNSFAILLFDFMIELSILILDTCNDSELENIRSNQIRCYYKWLRKHKIYLPKELQEKIYRYL